jgi:hypothetical protein
MVCVSCETVEGVWVRMELGHVTRFERDLARLTIPCIDHSTELSILEAGLEEVEVPMVG